MSRSFGLQTRIDYTSIVDRFSRVVRTFQRYFDFDSKIREETPLYILDLIGKDTGRLQGTIRTYDIIPGLSPLVQDLSY